MQFQSIGFIEAVAQVLPEGGIGGGLLELELTEPVLMDDLVEVKQRLAHLKAMGRRSRSTTSVPATPRSAT